MLLNHYTQIAPYALQNPQETNLNLVQSTSTIQTELESIQQPLIQPLPLHLVQTPDFFAMDQPFLCDEQMDNEIHNAIPPLFADLNNASLTQPSFLSNNDFIPSHFSQACEAISYDFPNQFTWSSLPIPAADLTSQPISHVNLPAEEPVTPAKTNDDLFPISHKTRKKRTVQRLSKNHQYQPIAPRLPLKQNPKLTAHSTSHGTSHPLPQPTLPCNNLMPANPVKDAEKIGQVLPNTLHENKDKVEKTARPSFRNRNTPARAAQNRMAQKRSRERHKEFVSDLKEQSKELDDLKNAVEKFSNQIEQFQLPPRLAASKMSGLEILGVLKSEMLEMLKQSVHLA